MNLNLMAVRVRMLTDVEWEGRLFEAGSVHEVRYNLLKKWEREGCAERVYEIEGACHAPLRDILMFTPMLRLETETVLALMNLEWDGALSLLIQRDNPSGQAKADHLHQYQRGRETFLRGPYEAMLVIESDVIPPRDVLTRLAKLEADCAYGVYRFQGETGIVNVYEKFPTIEPAPVVGYSLSEKPHLLEWALKEGVVPCSGAGLGCVLIRRRVLEAIDFRLEDGERGPFCDTPFTQDLTKHGFSQAADLWAVCGHKGRDGVIRWPSYASEEGC